jgi:hypothetical protein
MEDCVSVPIVALICIKTTGFTVVDPSPWRRFWPSDGMTFALA